MFICDLRQFACVQRDVKVTIEGPFTKMRQRAISERDKEMKGGETEDGDNIPRQRWT